MQYYKLEKLSVSFGKASQKKNNKKNHFIHFCNTEKGSSGSSLLLLSTNKVIGIHNGAYRNLNCNIGILLYEAIIDFNKQNQDKIKEIQKRKSINERESYDLKNYWNTKKIFISEILPNNFYDKKIFDIINFNKIEKLNLSNCNVINILEKRYLNNLKELYLSNNNLINIDNLKNIDLYNLEILDLKINKISNIYVFHEINLRYLKKLFLSQNNISDIGAFIKTNLIKIELLDLTNNKISDISALQNMVTLKEFY